MGVLVLDATEEGIPHEEIVVYTGQTLYNPNEGEQIVIHGGERFDGERIIPIEPGIVPSDASFPPHVGVAFADELELTSPGSANDSSPSVSIGLGRIEAGTTTINERSWARVALYPFIKSDRFLLELILPFTFQRDLLDTTTYHRPQGNDEWSFGGDHAGTSEFTPDVVQDILLKLSRLSYRSAGGALKFDAGNLPPTTIGTVFWLRGSTPR